MRLHRVVLKTKNYRYTIEFSDWINWLHTVYGFDAFLAAENGSVDFKVFYGV